jgi:hypothetical protein
MQLHTHLYSTYGVITPINIEDNNTKMREPFDPTLPTKTLFDQIVSRAYLIILQTGMYPDACPEWRYRALVDQTWPNFKTNFS